MSVDKTEIFATGGFIFSLVFALLVASGLVGCNPGCGLGSGSCIGIGEPQDPLPPTCAEQVTDECVDTVVAEFCAPECEVCEDRERFELQLHNARQSGYNHGLADAEAIYGDCNEAQARQDGFDLGYQNGLDNAWDELGDYCDDADSDRHEHDKGKGHRDHGKGKGKGHASNTCKTTCIPWPGGGGTDCTTVCDDARVA